MVDPDQAQHLLAAVGRQGGNGPGLVAFFACLYYSALRPGEAAALTESALAIPQEGWGELFLPGSAPTTGAAWSHSGRRRDRRGLKHRSPESTRPVPCPPPPTALLRAHLREYGTNSQAGFSTPRVTLRATCRTACTAACGLLPGSPLSPGEAASPPAARPYDLRHAAVSTWLDAGVPPTQVAERAGHGVAVLLRVYAKCLAGQEDAARQRVGVALGLGPARRPVP